MIIFSINIDVQKLKCCIYFALSSLVTVMQCVQKGNEPGKFRQLDEIMYIDGYPGYQSLSSIAEKTMPIVCDLKGTS